MAENPPVPASDAEPLPFEHLFVLLVAKARSRLRQQADPDAYALLTPAAHAGWERYLLTRLTRAGAKAAHWQFQIFRTVRQAFPLARSGKRRKADALYRDFVGVQPEDRLGKLFSEFPGLFELSGVLIENWLSTVAAFLSQLRQDRDGLNTAFPKLEFRGVIISVRAGLSDPHRGGRCVARIVFESGASLFYKPRSLAPEALFSEMLGVLNANGAEHRFRAAQCWDRGDYGWMEDIEHRACASIADVHAFYWRAGALLGLVFLARGIDFHRENVVAAGGFPVLVDLEALGHVQAPDKHGLAAAATSVLRTGFLPHGSTGARSLYEWSAFHRHPRPLHSMTTWRHVNQDDMHFQTEQREFASHEHLPMFAGAAHLASEYVPEIQRGYCWLGEQLLNEAGREEFAQWLGRLLRCPRRRIIRSTVHYQPALEMRTSAEFLRGGQIPAATLVRPLRGLGCAEAEQERTALHQMDIPYFVQREAENIPSTNDTVCCATGHYFAQLSLIEESLAGTPNPEQGSVG